jgi:GNAT superfamily N-acetyltransferase
VTVVATGFEPRVIELNDRTKVHLRSIQPEDEPLLHEAVASMSERTVYFRFFSPIKRMSDALAHRLAVVDYKDRFALVATTHKPSARDRIVGVARYDRAPQTDVAEVAVAVIDEFQRRGLGGVLLSELARVAKTHGISNFQLIVLPENREMFGCSARWAGSIRAKLAGGVYEISFDCPSLHDRHLASGLRGIAAPRRDAGAGHGGRDEERPRARTAGASSSPPAGSRSRW